MNDNQNSIPDSISGTLEEKVAEYTKYHAADPEQIERMRIVREATANLMEKIVKNCKPNADRSAALRQARSALMWANAAIVLPEISL